MAWVVLPSPACLGGPPVRVRVLREPPRHAGLGSTTQAMLAVYCAASRLLGAPCEPVEAAARLGRGRVSGVGVLAFKHGGFVADAGAPDPGGPRLLLRHPVPEGWVFVIAIPRARRGPGEAEEEPILSRPWPPPDRAARLMAEGFVRLASGVARGDLRDALRGLSAMQAGTGLYFSKYQGGVYRRDLAAIVAEAEKEGLKLAQSSWGPTLYTIVEEGEASWAASVLRGILRSHGPGGRVVVAGPMNRGALMEGP